MIKLTSYQHSKTGSISNTNLLAMLLCLSLMCGLVQAETNVLGQEISPISQPAKTQPNQADINANQAPAFKQEQVPPSFVIPDGNTSELIFPEDADLTVNTEDSSEGADQYSNVITIESDDLWERIKAGYGMPDLSSSLVAQHEKHYSANPEYVRRMVERSQRYLFHIVEEVEKRGMPTEIALLPMVESAFNPQAYSKSHASGIWQFIPSTGKVFGLKQNWWVDNRRNITVATDAALNYLQKLYGMFGSWDLALAAYNAGEGTVGRAIEQNRKQGLATNYESLNLPLETRNYVPKLQAIKNLMTNPGKYGLKIQTIANTAYFTKVTAPAQIDARLAAKLAEISDAEFLALNPSYNRPVIASANERHELLLPITSAQTFRENLAAYNKPLVTWKTYQAKRGERMDKVASKFGIQVEQLRNANDLPKTEKFSTASTILVPKEKSAEAHQTKALDVPTEPIQEIKNEDEILKAQNAANINLSHTEKLALSSAEDAKNINESDTNKNKTNKIEPSLERTVTHKIKKGETLQSIAKQYDVSVKQILAINTLKSTRVNVGQTLKIKTEVAEPIMQKLNNSKVAHNKKADTKSRQTNKNKVKQEQSNKKVQRKAQKQQKPKQTKNSQKK
ncbi:MAG TPA: transglycosylase SLT domain-containing protein [Methylophilaceae bacterium]|nr:transglycosylase SLT domain-containing protein [Methylophilaceae bacterium]